jgi:hypothetical protein
MDSIVYHEPPHFLVQRWYDNAIDTPLWEVCAVVVVVVVVVVHVVAVVLVTVSVVDWT